MAPVTFCLDSDRTIQPYYVSPWQGEGLKLEPPVLVPLRGDFFCLPFGVNNATYEGLTFRPHGEPAGSPWTLISATRDGAVTTLTLALRTLVPAGTITKTVHIVDGQNVVYSQERLEGYSLKTPIGHHAILAVPEKEGSLRVATSRIRFGMTSPVLFSDPARREYQSFAVGQRFDSLSRVPLLWKDAGPADGTSFPARTGFADLLAVFSEPAETLPAKVAWTTVTNEDGGYLWFALRDPRVLPATVFWIENHGRHSVPWNGRNRCLGLEDACGYFNEGLPVSAQPNDINAQGIPTALALEAGRPTLVNYIQGVAKVPAGFHMVKDVEFGAGELTFVSVTGIRMTVPVNFEFVRTGKLIDKLYGETYRPQFHFTPAKNWTNDPNGLVYYKGVYHLFFQHNPFGIQWGNMTWGHATSHDLVHWTEHAPALHPDKLGTIFSGSAVVDFANTAGFQTGGEKVIVCIYTSAGGTSAESQGQPFTQSLAYSNDGGATWTKYEKNPVLGHMAGSNRDPKVIWHKPTMTWIMALYLDGSDYALFGSKDLKAWTKLCDVMMPGTGECPDFFDLPVDGDPSRRLWVFWGANGNYRLGTFDGTTFKPETGVIQSLWGANDYAAQTYSNIPESDGRRIQIAWMNGGRYPGMPFNQQMSSPRELRLRTTPQGVRLSIMPVREIEGIRRASKTRTDVVLKADAPGLSLGEGELWDIKAALEPRSAQAVGLRVRGVEIVYDSRTKTLTCLGKTAPLEPVDGRIELRVLVDRTSIEIFAGGGLVTMCSCFLPNLLDRSLGAFARGGEARIAALKLHELESAWK